MWDHATDFTPRIEKHTLGYLLVTGVIALVVYRKLGLRLLGRVWVNLDLVWGAALVATGLATPFL